MAERRRSAAKDRTSPAAVRETTERKIYVLPTEQVERIKAFQTANGIASEVEAVRRLLDQALEMRDTVLDLLNKLKSRFAHEKDFRVLAKDILAGHSRVQSINFADGGLEFSLGTDERGRIDGKGFIYTGGNSYNDWDVVRDPPPSRAPTKGGLDAPKGADLDDDIPF